MSSKFCQRQPELAAGFEPVRKGEILWMNNIKHYKHHLTVELEVTMYFSGATSYNQDPTELQISG